MFAEFLVGGVRWGTWEVDVDGVHFPPNPAVFERSCMRVAYGFAWRLR